MSYENNNNNSREFDAERENRSVSGTSREVNRNRKNQQIQKNESRSAQHSSSGVSVGMTKPPIKPSFIIAAVTIFLVVIISVIFIIRSLPDTSSTTPDTTTPSDTAPSGTTPADTSPSDTTPTATTPSESSPVDTTPVDTSPVDTTPIDTTPVDTTPIDTTPIDTTPGDTTPVDTSATDTTPADTTPVAPPEPTLRDVVYPNASMKVGLLTLVNSSNPVVLPSEKIQDKTDPSVYYYEHLPYARFSSYEGQRVVGLRSFIMYMTRDTAVALDNMLYDFIVATGGFSAENATRVGKPLLFKAFDESDLTSEFALGTTIHLKVTDASATLTFSEADGYTWLYENAHKYGFILRYPEGKEEVTGEEYNDGIFRYVGVPHATAMYKLDMCYEEYVAAMKSTYTVDDPYEVTYTNVDTGETESYLIYYVAAANGDNTNIPVYAETSDDAIAISGDGASGFIVTVKE